MTMSCDADANATHSARQPSSHRFAFGGEASAMPAIPATSASCVSSIQPRRRPRNGGTIAVHHRRPEELEQIGDADPGKPGDGHDVDAGHGEPGLQRAPGQRERQAGGKAEQQHGGDARAAENLGIGTGHRSHSSFSGRFLRTPQSPGCGPERADRAHPAGAGVGGGKGAPVCLTRLILQCKICSLEPNHRGTYKPLIFQSRGPAWKPPISAETSSFQT